LFHSQGGAISATFGASCDTLGLSELGTIFTVSISSYYTIHYTITRAHIVFNASLIFKGNKAA
jgi:hypothetical protein